MAKKRLGVGLIGAGFIGKFHIKSWVGVRNADILGIVDKKSELSKEAAALCKKLDVGEPKVFKSIADMVADPSIDAVWICAPNFTRIDVMEEIVGTIESGKGKLIGVCCEKPLGRNVAEAKKLQALVKRVNLLDGYLEDQIFSVSTVRGKNILWGRGAAVAGRPYLARAAEEHSGPHMPWFWDGVLQGGGVLNDMMCHSVETARFLLTPPGAPRNVIRPKKVTAYTNCLKWQLPKYAKKLSEYSKGKLDYLKKPAEDFARSLVEYEDEKGNPIVVETTTSWSYVGAGLRLAMEVLGPEYSMSINSLDTDLKIFMSREVKGQAGEDLVEKQNAEIGLMPIVSDEEGAYGYTGENRHMVQSFLAGKRPDENFDDGVEVTELLMTAYRSAEAEKTIEFPWKGLDKYIPPVARGEWNPRKSK
ncbi:Gfo/Idh/MocA family oxidoreductase [bacterium]|nr:Gfo/Idh/MocA family oxidoreductase [bacterium]